MAFLFVITEFFRWIGVRNIIIVILGTIVFFTVKSTYFSKTREQVQVTSLFQKIEHVEQLRLVTYYYEEIIAIGTSDRLQKLVERARDRVNEAERKVIVDEILRDSLKGIMEDAIIRYNSADENLNRFEDAYFAARDTFEFFDLPIINPFNKIRWKLDSVTSWYGDEVEAMYRDYLTLEEAYNFAEKQRKTVRRRDRGEWKDTADARKSQMKAKEEQIINYIKRRRDRLEENLQSKKQILKAMEKQSEKLRKDLKKVQRDAIKAYEKAESKVLDARGGLEKAKLNLIEAEAEFLKRQGKPLPKLLVVVSAEVTGMVDLKELDFNTEVYPDKNGGDSLVMVVNQIPKARTDSVLIHLSETKRFQTSGGSGTSLFTKQEEGLYYEVYQQLKDALIETEGIVTQKAIDAGILDETNELAIDYVEGIGKSVGFKVNLEKATTGVYATDGGVASDSTEIISDSLNKVLEQFSDSLSKSDSVYQVEKE